VSIQGRRKGYYAESGPGFYHEVETFTCGHCQHVVKVQHGAALGQAGVGEFCLCCMAPICCSCNAEMNRTRKCVPVAKKIDEAYARRRLFEAMGI
jgi:hypothetical protein